MDKYLVYITLFILLLLILGWFKQNQYSYHTLEGRGAIPSTILRIDKFSGKAEKQVFEIKGKQKYKQSGVWVPVTHRYKRQF